MTRVMRVKRKLFLSGVMSVGVAWGVTLYWTLVSHGYLVSPWVV